MQSSSVNRQAWFIFIGPDWRATISESYITYLHFDDKVSTALARSRQKNCGLNQNGLRTESEVRKRGRLTRPLTLKRSNSENHQGCPRKRSNSENGVSTKDVPDEEAVPKEPRGLEATLEHLHKNNNNNNNNKTKCNTEEQYTRIRMDDQKAEDKIDVSAIHVFPQMPSCSVKYEVDMIVYGIGNQTTTRTTTTTTAKGKLRATPHQERFLVED